jgi:hypothetical protein
MPKSSVTLLAGPIDEAFLEQPGGAANWTLASVHPDPTRAVAPRWSQPSPLLARRRRWYSRRMKIGACGSNRSWRSAVMAK